jgi:hypothetical protein
MDVCAGTETASSTRHIRSCTARKSAEPSTEAFLIGQRYSFDPKDQVDVRVSQSENIHAAIGSRLK